jgi:hypothetical protein
VNNLKKNVLWWDRILRFFAGVFLLAWAIAGGPTWTYIGAAVLATGAWGYCPVLAILGVRNLEDR